MNSELATNHKITQGDAEFEISVPLKKKIKSGTFCG